MNFENHTLYEAGYSTGILQNGQYCIVVVIKATYDLPQNSETPLNLSEKQVEIYDTDAFVGEPGYSSPLYENDYATHKPKCDVIIQNPKAYAPDGKPVQQLEVSLQIGRLHKSFNVLGQRTWERLGLFVNLTEPEAFTEMPLSWEIAYGGTDDMAYKEEELSDAYLANPVGVGYWRKPKAKIVKNTPIAQTEEIGKPIDAHFERYAPQGFGVIGRNWMPRSQYGGTYDDEWEKNIKPFLPADFNELYYQCAPEDQQIEHPSDEEKVTLKNVTVDGELVFNLPNLDVPVQLKLATNEPQELEPKIDTIIINTGENTLTMVARTNFPFIHSIHEIKEIEVGEKEAVEIVDLLEQEAHV